MIREMDWRLAVTLAVILCTLGSLCGLVAEGNAMLERILAFTLEQRRMQIAATKRELAAAAQAQTAPHAPKETATNG